MFVTNIRSLRRRMRQVVRLVLLSSLFTCFLFFGCGKKADNLGTQEPSYSPKPTENLVQPPVLDALQNRQANALTNREVIVKTNLMAMATTPDKVPTPIRSPIGFIEPSADSIIVNGKKYTVEQALVGLNQSLDTTNSESKKQWLSAASELRSGLNGATVTRLIQEFQTEPNAEVRQALLHAIQFSQDPRFTQVCLSARNDPDAFIRLSAGVILIEQNNIDGVDVITGCLPDLKEREKQLAVASLQQAAHQFQMGYTTSLQNPVLGKLSSKEETSLFVAEWTSWWKDNKLRYNRNR